MGLNDIILPASTVSSLYENSLVDTGDAAVIPAATKATIQEKPVEAVQPALKKLGNNGKNILLIANEETTGNDILPPSQIQFITDILKACKLTLDDVALINKKDYSGHSFKELNQLFPGKIILLFGIEPVALELPVNFPAFQVQAFNNNTFLYSPSLNEVQNDKLLKSKLWVCLKQVFKL